MKVIKSLKLAVVAFAASCYNIISFGTGQYLIRCRQYICLPAVLKNICRIVHTLKS